MGLLKKIDDLHIRESELERLLTKAGGIDYSVPKYVTIPNAGGSSAVVLSPEGRDVIRFVTDLNVINDTLPSHARFIITRGGEVFEGPAGSPAEHAGEGSDVLFHSSRPLVIAPTEELGAEDQHFVGPSVVSVFCRYYEVLI